MKKLYESMRLISKFQNENFVLFFRCFFIMDDVSSFSADEKFFKFQLDKDLAINVYKNEEWGCYIRQPLDPLPLINSSHVFVNIKSSGSRPYLQWSQGPMSIL